MTREQREKLSKIALAVSLASLIVAFGATMLQQGARERRQERARLEQQDMQVRLDALRKGANASERARLEAVQKDLDALKRATK